MDANLNGKGGYREGRGWVNPPPLATLLQIGQEFRDPRRGPKAKERPSPMRLYPAAGLWRVNIDAPGNHAVPPAAGKEVAPGLNAEVSKGCSIGPEGQLECVQARVISSNGNSRGLRAHVGAQRVAELSGDIKILQPKMRSDRRSHY